jgi:hypothetical protein
MGNKNPDKGIVDPYTKGSDLVLEGSFGLSEPNVLI